VATGAVALHFDKKSASRIWEKGLGIDSDHAETIVQLIAQTPSNLDLV
jgi:hypothetical protein